MRAKPNLLFVIKLGASILCLAIQPTFISDFIFLMVYVSFKMRDQKCEIDEVNKPEEEINSVEDSEEESINIENSPP